MHSSSGLALVKYEIDCQVFIGSSGCSRDRLSFPYWSFVPIQWISSFLDQVDLSDAVNDMFSTSRIVLGRE